eukprot:TRINITY_DN69995_c0_g1_i1.p1 TRINITY_DN69995_c0_g1~~TRINITY_DN69995_c0_g1_i1.p1  ORF type:complete len:615 (+),score=145.38 TRINITY_DN69995_c0_g1_i1:105-1949(+)
MSRKAWKETRKDIAAERAHRNKIKELSAECEALQAAAAAHDAHLRSLEQDEEKLVASAAAATNTPVASLADLLQVSRDAQLNLQRDEWAAAVSRCRRALELLRSVATGPQGDRTQERPELTQTRALLGSNLHSTIGTALWKQGDYAGALVSHRVALKLRLQSKDPHTMDTASSHTNIGLALNSLKEYSEALEAHQLSLSIRRQLCGAQSTEVAECSMHLAQSYAMQGKYESALECCLRTLHIHIQAFRSSDPTTATIYNTTGLMYTKLFRYPMAVRCFVTAYRLQIKAHGLAHPETCGALTNLGHVQCLLGNWEFASWLYMTAAQGLLSISRGGTDKLLSDSEQMEDVALAHTNAGNALMECGRFSQALHWHEMALTIRQKMMEEEGVVDEFGRKGTPRTLNPIALVQSCIAAARYRLEDYRGAKHWHDEASVIRNRLHSHDSPHYGVEFMRTCAVEAKMGELETSVPRCLEPAVETFERHFGVTHPETSCARTMLGHMMRLKGDRAGAEEQLHAAYANRLIMYGDRHVVTACGQNNYGCMLSLKGHHESAMAMHTSAYKTFSRSLGCAHPDTIRAHSWMGHALQHAALDGLDDIPDPEPPSEGRARCLPGGRL